MRRGTTLRRVAVAVLATVGVAVVLAAASALVVVSDIPCASMLGPSIMCGGLFGGWPIAFVPLEPGNQVAGLHFLFLAFGVDVVVWTVPAALIVAVLWSLFAAVRRARRPRAR